MKVVGGYEIEVNTHGLPQKVMSGFTKVFENFTGAKYDPIAYLGSKVVNGINHAILCHQTLNTAKDIDSIVLLVLNEKPGDMHGETFEIVTIEPYLSNGGMLGGFSIEPTTTIPAEAQNIFDRHFSGYFGANTKAFALLATKVVHGACYVFAVESSLEATNPMSFTKGKKSIQLVSLYSDFSEVNTITVLEGTAKNSESNLLQGSNDATLRYAFTWLKNWP